MFYDNFKFMKYCYSLFLGVLLASCQLENNGFNDADNALNKWAEAYFNFDYKEAMGYMTPESAKWIRFAASNITEKDVEFIRSQNQNTVIHITDRQDVVNDTLYNATIDGEARRGMARQNGRPTAKWKAKSRLSFGWTMGKWSSPFS